MTQIAGRPFAAREARVWSRESAVGARHRFAAALDAVVGAHTSDRLAVITHGTVLALHVAARNRLDPLDLRRDLNFAAVLVLSLPGHRLLDAPDGSASWMA